MNFSSRPDALPLLPSAYGADSPSSFLPSVAILFVLCAFCTPPFQLSPSSSFRTASVGAGARRADARGRTPAGSRDSEAFLHANRFRSARSVPNLLRVGNACSSPELQSFIGSRSRELTTTAHRHEPDRACGSRRLRTWAQWTSGGNAADEATGRTARRVRSRRKDSKGPDGLRRRRRRSGPGSEAER